jgi:hypothetical protein
VYKPNKTHVGADAFSRLPDNITPTSVPNQTTNASLFNTWHEWPNDVKDF